MYAIRGRFTDITYFLCTLTLSEAADQLHFANPDEAKSFRERVQRTLNEKRAKEIFETYLKRQGNRFFNSLVVVLVPKKEVSSGYYEFDPFEDDEGNKLQDIGVLKVLSDIERIVVDGQHRLFALKQANVHVHEPTYDQSLKLREIQVPVVFLTFEDVGVRRLVDKGEDISIKVNDRARRVFVDLNKEAKKVDKNSLLILDDEDFSAVAARNLIESNSALERYTKWSGGGTTLADADPFFTNIQILDEIIDYLLPEGAQEEIANKYILADDEDREVALKTYFRSKLPNLYGLTIQEFLESFFEHVQFFPKWKQDIERILGAPPELQPKVTQLTTKQRGEIRDIRKDQLMATVVGQQVALRSVADSFAHFKSNDPKQMLRMAIERLNVILENGGFSRANPLWLELLTRPGGKMKLNAKESSQHVLNGLLLGTSSTDIKDYLSALVEQGVGREETYASYAELIGKLPKR
jgi:DGQHR domain-containing protein